MARASRPCAAVAPFVARRIPEGGWKAGSAAILPGLSFPRSGNPLPGTRRVPWFLDSCLAWSNLRPQLRCCYRGTDGPIRNPPPRIGSAAVRQGGGSLTRWGHQRSGDSDVRRVAAKPASERFARVHAGGRNAKNSPRTTASGVPAVDCSSRSDSYVSRESLFTPCRRGPTMKWQTENEGALADAEIRRAPQAEVPVGKKRNA